MLPPRRLPILFSGQVQPAYICLPSKIVDGEELMVDGKLSSMAEVNLFLTTGD